MKYFLIIFVLFLLFLGCSIPIQKISSPVIGPKNVPVELNKYQEIRYVSSQTGSDETGDGGSKKPWQSINFALTKIGNTTSGNRYALLVGEGYYGGKTIELKSFIDLYGGFKSNEWQRNIFKHKSILVGGEVNRILAAADDVRIDGFTLLKGQVRGKGAGILCQGVSPIISNNVFVENRTLIPIPWKPKYRHEIANDGGAIYCENGSSPVIENNLFFKNTTEAGRGAAIAFHKECNGRIANNVFMDNTVGLNDPLRSSDGGAVSIFCWSSPTIENNVFLNNKALANNDAGALFVALWCSPTLKNNIFVGNECHDDAGALFVGGQEHRYDSPFDPFPLADKFFVKISENVFFGNSNPTMNSGAIRFTMESRGSFTNNITAFNTGVYFERSEAEIVDNLIFDNFLYKDTKEGLKPGILDNNTIWGEFRLDTDAVVTNCNIRDGYTGEGNYSEYPNLVEDGFQISAISSQYSKNENVTSVFFPDKNIKPNELINRVVKCGTKWSVIKSNDTNTIKLWGDFSGEVSFTVLPTYKLEK